MSSIYRSPARDLFVSHLQRERFFWEFFEVVFFWKLIPLPQRGGNGVGEDFFFFGGGRSRSAVGTVFWKLIPFLPRCGNGCVAEHEFLIMRVELARGIVLGLSKSAILIES
jgi:hypothetical protein